MRRFDREPQIVRGRDGTLLKAMLATWGEQTVLQLIDEFVSSDDRWIQQRGWTIAGLRDVAQRLLLKQAETDSLTESNRDAAWRATQRRAVVVEAVPRTVIIPTFTDAFTFGVAS
jgi:hypothetical protein